MTTAGRTGWPLAMLIRLYRASLTTREQREFDRAERTIVTGLKSFLAVGLALKEIRGGSINGRLGAGAVRQIVTCGPARPS